MDGKLASAITALSTDMAKVINAQNSFRNDMDTLKGMKPAVSESNSARNNNENFTYMSWREDGRKWIR